MPKKRTSTTSNKRPAKLAPVSAPFTFTLFPTVKASSAQEAALGGGLREFAAALKAAKTYPEKTAMPLFCPMSFDGTRTPDNSLRHNAGVTDIYGACGDYDAEKMPMEQAAAAFRRAGVEAAFYTSPRYAAKRPRWRVVVQFSAPTKERGAHLGAVEKMNHLTGGVLTGESFTLSQSYYFGRVQGAPYKVIHVPGRPIDAVDIPRLPKRLGAAKGANGEAPADSEAALIAALVKGEEIHPAMLDLVNLRLVRGEAPAKVRGDILGLVAHSGRDEGRIAAATGELDRLLEGARVKGIGIRPEVVIARAAATLKSIEPAPGKSLYGFEAVAARLAAWTPPTLAKLTEVRPQAFYVDGLILRRVAGEIVATGGTGKTILFIRLGIATATGGEWLGMKVEEGSFVLVSLDDSQDELDDALALLLRDAQLSAPEVEKVRTRLRLVSLRGMPDSAVIAFAYALGGASQPSGLDAAVIEGLKGLADLRCIVFDTARQFAGGSTNEDRIASILTAAMTRITDALACAAFFAHHKTKEGARGGDSDHLSGSGSGALGDNLRLVLVLDRSSMEDAEKVMHVEPLVRAAASAGQVLRLSDTRGSITRMEVAPVYIARVGFRFVRITGKGKSPAEREGDERMKALAAIAGGAGTVSALQAALKKKREAVGPIIAALIEAGLAERVTKRAGVTATEAGRAKLGRAG